MTAFIKFLASSVLFFLLFSTVDFHRISANPNNDLQEHAAWGGNGGWWGGGNHDFYDDYAWRTDDSSSRCRRCRHYHPICSHCGYRHPDRGRYTYHDCYTPPVNEYEYNDSVAGAGLYLNLEPRRRCNHCE